MQRNLLLLFAVIFAYTVNAQTIFEHDFNDGLDPMTINDNDGNTPHSSVSAFADAWTITPISDDNNVAVSNSYYTPAAAADDWLITPAIEIEEEGYFFIWEAYAVDGTYTDGYEVLVSTTDNEVASFTEVLYATSAENLTFTKRGVDLSAYSGETVYVAIRNNSFDKYLLVVDNISITKLAGKEVSAVSFNNYRWHNVNDAVKPSVTLRNNGSETITQVDVEYSVNGTAYNETISGLNIPTFQEAEIELSEEIVIAAADQYDVEITFTNPNGGEDSDLTNNSGIGYLNGISKMADRKIVVEEGTGTWCTWCPRGHVFMELMKEEYPDKFIGIAVHNGDPMVLDEHDTESDFAGYPSAHVNRSVRNINPSDLEQYIISEQDVAVPFDADIDVQYDETSGEVTITGAVVSNSNISAGDFRMAVIITEDNVTGTGSGYAQVNQYSGGANGPMGGYENLPNPVPASDMVYQDVSRALLGGYYGMEGSIGSSIAEGNSKTATFTYNLPTGADPSDFLAALVVLDDETGVILNGAEDYVKTPVSIFNTELADIESTIYPNPANDIAVVEINLEKSTDVSITMVDMTGKIVSSVDYGKAQGKAAFQLNVSDIHPGVYLVNIRTEEGISTKKLTVTK